MKKRVAAIALAVAVFSATGSGVGAEAEEDFATLAHRVGLGTAIQIAAISGYASSLPSPCADGSEPVDDVFFEDRSGYAVCADGEAYGIDWMGEWEIHP
jgi:hypothetical protein